MDISKILSLLKSNWKNVSLCALAGLVAILGISLAAAKANNAHLKDELSAKYTENGTMADELKTAQDELEALKSQYATMSEQVSPEVAFALNGVDATTGTVTAEKTASGAIVYRDEKGDTLKKEDGSPLTFKDVQAIIEENETLKTEKKELESTVSNLKANNKGSNSNSNSSGLSSSDLNTLTTLANENENLQNQVNSLNDKVNALSSANDTLANLNNALADELDKNQNNGSDVANAALKYADELTGTVGGLESDNAALTAELTEVKANMDVYKAELIDKMNNLTDAKLKAATLQTNLTSLNNSLDDTEAQLEAVTTAYNELTGSIDSANIIEAYREALDNLNADKVSVQAQIDDLNSKTEWNELDQARYDTLQARIDAGDESLASIDDMTLELYNLLQAHTLTTAEEEAIADLEAQLADLETQIETAKTDLENAEATWLTSNPNNSLDNLLSTDEALRTKITELENEIAEKTETLADAESDITQIESEMYRLKESIRELEAQYGALALEDKLQGSYENANGDIDFGLSGTTTEYNELVSSVENMITSLKNRVNSLLDYVDEMITEIRNGLIEAGDDVTEETETIVGDDGNTYEVKVLKSKLIHKKVNIVLFRGSQDQITIKGQMPYGQISKVSQGSATKTIYFEEENGESNGTWYGAHERREPY